jgi:hypothetical protein
VDYENPNHTLSPPYLFLLITDNKKYIKIGFFVETPGLLDRIDRIIDREYGEHDLGRRADPWSLGKELFCPL